MNWAEVDGARSMPAPGMVGRCPACQGEVIAKCGEIVSWHWAHKVKDCDFWSEPESEWHKMWKSLFPEQWQECSIGPHRADVVTPLGIIEFQKSFLQSHEIRKREEFYRVMTWVVDASGWQLRRSDSLGPRQRTAATGFFIWRRPRKTWLAATAPVYFDIGTSHPFLYRIDGTSSLCGLLSLHVEKIRKEVFVRVFHGLGDFRAALPKVSSYDHYGEALRRRSEVMELMRQKSQQAFDGLPLFDLGRNCAISEGAA